jgi:hypothetical protein
VTLFTGLVLPTAMSPKLMLAGDTMTAAVEAPARATLAKSSPVLLSTTRLALSAVLAGWLGVKTSEIVQLLPAASVPLQVLVVTAKSEELAPVNAGAPKLSGPRALTVSLTDFGALVLPWSTSPKLRAVGETVATQGYSGRSCRRRARRHFRSFRTGCRRQPGRRRPRH